MRTAGWIAECAAAPALVAATLTGSLNDLGLFDVAVVALWLWPVFAVVLAGPLLLTVLLFRLARRRCRWDHLAGVTLAGLFGALWACRLEPAHQLLSVRPHLSRAATIEMLLITAASAAILAAVWGLRGRIRLLAVAFALVIGTVALSTAARSLEPTRDRTRSVSRVAATHPDRARAQDPPARVLMIGVDGLEWKAIERLIGAGRLPTIAALLDRGRFYQLDNRKMAISPQIWTALYTGYPEHDNAVGGFDAWRFSGASRPVTFLPNFGFHPIWMLDQLLDHLNLLGGWEEQAVTTTQIRKPPIWTIASSSGRRVAIVDPVPFWVIGERVNGLFAWPSLDGFRFTRRAPGDDEATIAYEPFPTTSRTPGTVDIDERARADFAVRAFADEQPDLGVYYTHFIDRLSHHGWDFRFPEGLVGGDPDSELARNFETTSVANAYAQIDTQIRDLIQAFGVGTVILVSDHGWEFNDYEHFLSPYGVLIVANTGATGYGGVVDLLSVSPTILSLLGLPIATDMQPPIAGLTTTQGKTTAYQDLHRDFVTEGHPIADPERRELLRSLGYLSGR